MVVEEVGRKQAKDAGRIQEPGGSERQGTSPVKGQGPRFVNFALFDITISLMSKLGALTTKLPLPSITD